jgi:hypothetical protein
VLVHDHGAIEAGLPSDEENAVEGTITAGKNRVPQRRMIIRRAWFQSAGHQLALLGWCLTDWLEDGYPTGVRLARRLRVHHAGHHDVVDDRGHLEQPTPGTSVCAALPPASSTAVLADRSTTGMSGIRREGAVDLQMTWSTAFAPAADQRHDRYNAAGFAQVTPLTAPSAVFRSYPTDTPTRSTVTLAICVVLACS